MQKWTLLKFLSLLKCLWDFLDEDKIECRVLTENDTFIVIHTCIVYLL